MRTIEIGLAEIVSVVEMERALTAACEEIGLSISAQGSLVRHDGNLHWHLKRENERGTLEVSYVPEPTRLWLAVHSNREGAWIDEVIARFPALLQCALAQLTSRETT